MNDQKQEPKKKALSSFHNLPSAFDHFEDILDITRKFSTILCLDYDGTLTPIVDNPEDAVLTDDMRGVVKKLAGKLPVAIVSGRGLDFIKKQVQLDEVYYAGSHGFEISGPEGFHHEKEEARNVLGLLDDTEKKLQQLLEDVQGLRIERKKYGIAVHYRQVQEDKVPYVKEKIDQLLDDEQRLKEGRGKMVIDLKPNIEWDKGRAVDFISDHLTSGKRESAALYIGDDITDEDAFHAIENGAGILVGSHDEQSAADYRLEDVDEVKRFLELLTKNLD